MKFICSHCGKEGDKATGHINRANKLGMKLFCSRVCFGLDRRVERTEDEKKRIKYEYDKKRREELKDEIQKRQKAYNESPAGRAMQKRHRDKRKKQHAEYIKSERYRKWKKEYDKKYVAKSNYGDFWEASIILNEIETILIPQRHEVKVQKGTYNKSKQRKRHGTYRQKSQGLTLGNPSRGAEWKN